MVSRAADIAIEKARTCGVAWVGTRHSNHAGPASLYAAYGKAKAKALAKRGEQMPVGWTIDRQGKPLLEPNRAGEGFLVIDLAAFGEPAVFKSAVNKLVRETNSPTSRPDGEVQELKPLDTTFIAPNVPRPVAAEHAK